MPTIIFIPSESIAFANCLASLSVGNVFVCLIDADDFNRRCFGSRSREVNDGFIFCRKFYRKILAAPWEIDAIQPQQTSQDGRSYITFGKYSHGYGLKGLGAFGNRNRLVADSFLAYSTP